MPDDPFLIMMAVLMAASAAVLLGLAMMSDNKYEGADETEPKTLKRQEQCNGVHCGHPLAGDSCEGRDY
jgi:hypothetical protein